MVKRLIPTKVDFYITNVCNLTCQNCNRFNNFDFKGWQDWKDYEHIYERWSKLVDLKAITIMGGEPFLNPSLKDWIAGLNRLFGIEVQVLTNGTRFLQAKGVYDTMLYRSEKENKAQNHIGVSLHRMEDFEQTKADIYQFLQGEVTEVPKEKNFWKSDWQFIDSNGVMINIMKSNAFIESTIVPQNNRYMLHNSDPKDAHDCCTFVKFKSYHFIRGKFYKCAPAGLLPEFDNQYPFDISQEDRNILHGYKALTVDNYADYNEEFFANLDNPIAQCKFCPSLHYDTTAKITPIHKRDRAKY